MSNDLFGKIDLSEVDTKEEIEEVLEDLAEIEEEIEEKSFQDLIREADKATNVPMQNIPKETVLEQGPVKEEIDVTAKPTLAILKELRLDELDGGHFCIKWAKENDNHFLGFSFDDGEPMFKEKK